MVANFRLGLRRFGLSRNPEAAIVLVAHDMSGLGPSQTLGEVTKILGSGRFSRIVNHFESEAEREQFVLAANGPFSRKAEALLQPWNERNFSAGLRPMKDMALPSRPYGISIAPGFERDGESNGQTLRLFNNCRGRCLNSEPLDLASLRRFPIQTN